MRIEQGQIGDVGIEDIVRLSADQLDQALQFGFGHQCLADGADGREFGCALLFGIEEARIFEGDAHAASQCLQQAHIRVGECVLAFHILQTEKAVDLAPVP